MKRKILQAMFAVLLCAGAHAQVNSGSDGSDGALNPTNKITIDMSDHPDGIYQYTSVNIPPGVTVSFTPNANNTPVVWLVQTDCVVNGSINLAGQSAEGKTGGAGGCGGFGGGNGQYDSNYPPGSGLGPGGGTVTVGQNLFGGNASFATTGDTSSGMYYPPGGTYGNNFLIPLIGGSGGGGSADNVRDYWGDYVWCGSGGGGGGGAILIASSSTINLGGSIVAHGGSCDTASQYIGGGGGSGGAVRLVASTINGAGSIDCSGGACVTYSSPFFDFRNAGNGRVRLDRLVDNFTGSIQGSETRGFQPIIIPAAGQQVQLAITSIAGISVLPNASSSLLDPAVIIPGQQANPIPVVVQCSNIPLNTPITVEVHPAIGATVTAVGLNTAGTQASSTATIPVNMPRGGGVILAQTVTPITFASLGNGEKYKSLAKTGWTADGERFAKVELTVTPAGKQRIVYLTASGKRYPLSSL